MSSGRGLMGQPFSLLKRMRRAMSSDRGVMGQPFSTSVIEDDGEDSYKCLMQLYEAAKKNKHDLIKGFFEAKGQLPPNELTRRFIDRSFSPLKNTLLHVAASFGSTETVKMILDDLMYPLYLRRKNLKGDTALHVAATAGHVSTVKALIWKKSDVESSSSSHGGVTLRDRVLLRLINMKQNTALHEALINGHIEITEALIEADPEVSFHPNFENKSPLYLAVKAGSLTLVQRMLERTVGVNQDQWLKGESPIHAAILNAATSRSTGTDIFRYLLEKESRFINLKDAKMNALHLAASVGYVKGVRYLLEKYAFTAVQSDSRGLFPIHLAAIEGHVDVIQILLSYCPDPGEMITLDGHKNILHVAAETGASSVVSYVLRTPELQKLLNQSDIDGNTPLHLATMNWHPKVVVALTWDERVDLKLVNNKRLTALDVAERMMETELPPYRQQLTRSVIKAARAPRAPVEMILNAYGPTFSQRFKMDNCKDRVNTLLLVSTLVVTVTFAAGFTMPGGNNDSDFDKGMAKMLGHIAFRLFIFCNTIAMYSSVVVAIVLIWAQVGDPHLVLVALKLAMRLLGIALIMMTSAFTAGVYLVVIKLKWLGIAVLVMGALFLTVLSLFFFHLSIPLSSSNGIIRHVNYYYLQLLIALTKSSEK